jgi:hypothetical protein
MGFTVVAATGAEVGAAVIGTVGAIGVAEVLAGADAVIGADVVVGVAEEASAALAAARFTNTALPAVVADSAAIAVASTAVVGSMAAVVADSTEAVDFMAGEAMAAATGNWSSRFSIGEMERLAAGAASRFCFLLWFDGLVRSDVLRCLGQKHGKTCTACRTPTGRGIVKVVDFWLTRLESGNFLS